MTTLHSSSSMSSKTVTTRVGVLTTWNQQCGLATYAKFMMSGFEPNTYVVLAEDCPKPVATDETFVERCWDRNSDDYSRLTAAITRNDLKLLHINCHYRFFSNPNFTQFLAKQRKTGVTVLLHLHQVYTTDQTLQEMLQEVDGTIVHNPESRLEAIANGATPSHVFVVPHGVNAKPIVTESERSALRRKLGIPTDQKIVVSFGFIQPHKGMEGVIEAVIHCRSSGTACRGYICGSPGANDPYGAEYLQKLKDFARAAGVESHIEFVTRFLDDDNVTEYLQAADVVLMNYRSQHFEASGACSLALGAGAVVATSIAPPFWPFKDAVWHITSGYPAALSVELLFKSAPLRNEIRARSAQFVAENAWPQIATKLKAIYSNLNLKISAFVKEKEKVVETYKPALTAISPSATTSTSLKVLMQNRPTATTHRGGDTVVMERTAEGLRAAGVSVIIDLECRENPGNYDLVHLFNFATPDFTRQLAERAHAAGTPFVVTTLCEDVSTFHNRSIAVAQTLVEYSQNGDKSLYKERQALWNAQPAAPNFNNSWVASHAAALLTNGESESAVLKRQYPNCNNFWVVPLGHEVAKVQGNDNFSKRFGVKDYVLCVGRFESRKNQLMLLKALEDSELPIVLVSGGFSYQPDYDSAVRNFKRKGKTIIAERLSAEELASAYQCCRVHVLPSWYELPGLVSLEAASYGKNVVVTDCGTTRDYLGDKAFYANPDDSNSIFNAVMAGYYSPVVSGLQATAQAFTWSQTAQVTSAVYQRFAKRPKLNTPSKLDIPSTIVGVPAMATPMSIEQILDQSEQYAANGDFTTAQALLQDAETRDPQAARVLRSRGAIFLAEGRTVEARTYFERALTANRNDARSWVGMGMCQMRNEDMVGATLSMQRALESDPDQLIAIRNLIECSYRTSNFGALESALRKYVDRHTEDVEMQFCLAGCLYKMGSTNEAWRWVDSILAKSPTHAGTIELKRLLGTRPTTTTSSTSASNSSGLANITAQIERINTSRTSPKQESGEIIAPVMDEIDTRLLSLEDSKRRAEFENVISGCSQILQRTTLKTKQREQATLLRAEALVLSGKVEQAHQDLDAALASNPHSARGLCGKAAIAAHENRWDEALKLFEQAHTADSRYDVALAGIGLYWFQHNQPEKAWTYFERAVEINPENSRALLGLIDIGYKIGRLEGVERAIQSYLDMHPADVEFLYSLAGCLFAQNKLSEATAEIEKIRLFAPNHRDAIELSTLIEQRQQSSEVRA